MHMYMCIYIEVYIWLHMIYDYNNKKLFLTSSDKI